MRHTVLKRLAACLMLVASLAAAAHAQESAFQDAKGESSIFLNDGGGFFHINPTDKSIKVGFTRDTGREKPYFGIDFTGKASGGFATLFNGGTPSPEAEVGFTVGKRFLTTKSDAEKVKECMKRVARELLTTGKADFIKEERKLFIERKTAENLTRLTKEENDKRKGSGSLFASIKEEIVREALQRGLSPNVANGMGESMAPKLVEVELMGKAKQDAETEANSPAGIQEIEDTAVRGVDGPASQVCVLDPEVLDARAFDWISLRVSYKRASYKVLNPSAAFADQVRRQNFDGFTTTLAYNRVITLDKLSKEALETTKGSKGSVIIGASIGVARRNNADNLRSVELEDQGFTSSSGTTQRRAVSKQTVLSGGYDEYLAVPINTDVVWYPGALNHRVAFDFFTRSDLGSTGRNFVPGVGLFLTQQKSPTKVVGGISFSYDDGKGKVGLVGGFHF